jgi:hypothetical protein
LKITTPIGLGEIAQSYCKQKILTTAARAYITTTWIYITPTWIHNITAYRIRVGYFLFFVFIFSAVFGYFFFFHQNHLPFIKAG